MYNLKRNLNRCISILIITEIPGYHEKERHCTSGKYLYNLPCLSRKAYMNAHYQTCCDCFYRIQTFISHFYHLPLSVVFQYNKAYPPCQYSARTSEGRRRYQPAFIHSGKKSRIVIGHSQRQAGPAQIFTSIRCFHTRKRKIRSSRMTQTDRKKKLD